MQTPEDTNIPKDEQMDPITATNEGGTELPTNPDKLDGEASESLTDWKQEPTILELKADLEFARQEHDEQVSNVAGWLNLRNATGAESGKKSKSPGRSGVQPKLIRKHNEWRYPALSEPFLNSDRMFEIKPRTGADIAASEQNQLLINWQFDTKLDKVDLIDRYIRKTVDEGTCILRVGWERTTEKVSVERPVYEYFEMNEFEHAEQMQVLAEVSQMYVEAPEEYEANTEIPDDLRASVEYSVENGIPVYAQETGTETVLEDKITANQPSVKIVDVQNFFIDPSCDGVWTDAQFMINTYESTKSDLKKRKIYKNLDKVAWSTNAVKNAVGNGDHESSTPLADSRVNQDKTKVLVYEYWGEFDIHKDGVMVPIVVTWIGDTIIQMTENPFPDRQPPFVVVPYMPILGSTFGEADASLLQDNQRVLGAVTRGMIDLLGRSANAQIGYAKGFLDPVNRKRFNAGEDFEFNPNADPRTQIQQMVYPEIPNSALQISAAQNQEAEGLSGVKSFSQGVTGEAYGKVARGISGALDAAGQREMSILRRMASGMKQVATKIISMNAFFLEESEVVRVTDSEFVDIKREELAGNFDLIVDISTAQVDEQKSQDLGMLLQTVGPDMDPGLRTIILAKIAKLKRMPDLADQMLAYKPEPDPLQVKMQELQIAELESKIMLNNARAEAASADAGKTEIEAGMAADGTAHAQNIEAMGAQARGNRDSEVAKALLKGEAAPQQIEAAVGFNKLTEDADQAKSQPKPQFTPPVNPAPMAPIAQPQQQPIAFPQ